MEKNPDPLKYCCVQTIATLVAAYIMLYSDSASALNYNPLHFRSLTLQTELESELKRLGIDNAVIVQEDLMRGVLSYYTDDNPTQIKELRMTFKHFKRELSLEPQKAPELD